MPERLVPRGGAGAVGAVAVEDGRIAYVGTDDSGGRTIHQGAER